MNEDRKIRNCPVCGAEPEMSITVDPKTGAYYYTAACKNPACRWKPHTGKHYALRDCLIAWGKVCIRFDEKMGRL